MSTSVSLAERRELMRLAAETRFKDQLINEGQEVPNEFNSTERISKLKKLKKRKITKSFSDMSEGELFNCFTEYISVRDFDILEELISSVPERINLVNIINHLKNNKITDDKEIITILLQNDTFKNRLLLHIIRSDDVDNFSQFIYSGTMGLMTQSLLDYTTTNCKNNIMEYLVKNHYHIDIFAYKGYRTAIKNNNLKQLKYLFDKGANPHISKSDDYELPDDIPNILLYYAIYYKSNKEIIQFINNNVTDIHYCKEYPIRLAVSLGYIPMVRTLIDMGANYQEMGSVLFITTIQKMDIEMLNYLLTKLPFYERQNYNDELVAFITNLEYFELLEKFFD